MYHVVEPGETLYSIGWLYGQDYRHIALWNDIPAPYNINRGQRLLVVPGDKQRQRFETVGKNKTATDPAVKVTKAQADKEIKDKNKDQATKPGKLSSSNSVKENSSQKLKQALQWRWPTRQVKILVFYKRDDPARQGLELAGQTGQAVYAAARGKVVYSGAGLSRYGKLVIVKHNETYLSAYAHNSELLVKEGDVLHGGQLIAKMGRTGTDRDKLHFEIRRNGKTVDPLRFLPRITR